MPNEQVLNHRVDTFIFFTVQFRIFMKRHVSRPANLPDLAGNEDRLAFQSVKFFAHISLRRLAILGFGVYQHKGIFVVMTRTSNECTGEEESAKPDDFITIWASSTQVDCGC